MTFAWPHLLWLLLVPAALLAWDLTRARRSAASSHPKILRAEAGTHSLRLSTLNSQPPTRHAPRAWLCLALVFSILALSRPQWGRIEEPVFDQSREILIAIDLSRSMLTPDIKPSRLERAKLLTQALLEKLSGERVGLVVFAGTAFLQSPLSADYEILREFLPALNPEFLPEGGTNYRALIDTCLSAFSSTTAADRFLIVLSDGEATDDLWRDRIDDLKKKGIRVIGLGVGTASGAMIPDGSGGLVKDERGAVVLSKLEPRTLRELADATGGTYHDASNWIDLAALIDATVEAGRKGQFLEKNTVRLVERFQWPLALALWLFLVSFHYEFPVRPKPRDIKLATTPPPAPKLSPAATTAALLLLCVLSLGLRHSAFGISPPPSPATPPSTLTRIVGRLADNEYYSGRDWAELAQETVTWGQRLQSEQQPVPEGPVHDALAAVKLGEKLDPKTADWPKLRTDLEQLLTKPPEQKPDDQKQQQDDQKQDQNNQGQQNKDDQQKKNQQQNQQQKPDQPDSKQNSPQNQQNQPQPKPDNPPDKQHDSAFGDMKDRPPPPPPKDTQKVGGAPDKKEDQQPVDPSLALPLQKLEQLRNQDSPAELFQLMDSDQKTPTKKPAKDW